MNGVTLIHESTRVAWSDTAGAVGLNRFDHYAESHPVGVHIDGKDETIHDITADDARRLAAVPVDLADNLEAG
jgi:predicted Zn-dependent peptidase